MTIGLNISHSTGVTNDSTRPANSHQPKVKPDLNESLKISTWSARNHLIVIGILIFLTFVSGYILTIYTTAASPFVDAFTTWGAIAALYLVAKKILENWFYWFVIDFVSVFLFISRELYPTALLFGVYLVLVVFGYRAWSKSLQHADEQN